MLSDELFNKMLEELNCDIINDIKVLQKYEKEIININPKLYSIFMILIQSQKVVKQRKDKILNKDDKNE